MNLSPFSTGRRRNRGKFVGSVEQEAAVQALTAALTQLAVDQILTYGQMGNMVGGNRNILYRAIRSAHRSHGYTFATVRGVGVKRMDPGDVSLKGVEVRAKASRMFKNTEDQIEHVVKIRHDDMSREQLNKATAELGLLGTLRLTAEYGK